MDENTYLIIDGYNIINKWSGLDGKRMRKNIEVARERFNTIIQKYSDYKGIRTTIVYDGSGKRRQEIGGNPAVVFSSGTETADSVIEAFVYSVGNPRDVTVATDDAVQRNFILGAGAFCISAQELEAEVNTALKQMRGMLG